MCLRTKPIFPRGNGLEIIKEIILQQVVETSTQDIVCYKGFEISKKKLITPHKHMEWPQDKVVTVKEFGIRNINARSGNFEVHEGLHAYSDKVNHKYFPGEVIKEMIIPANTPFIRSQGGSEIVALKMRLKDLVPKKVTKKAKKTKKKK